MTRINEVLYFVLYDLCKIKKTQNKSASVFSIGTPEWNRTTAHGSGGHSVNACTHCCDLFYKILVSVLVALFVFFFRKRSIICLLNPGIA